VSTIDTKKHLYLVPEPVGILIKIEGKVHLIFATNGWVVTVNALLIELLVSLHVLDMCDLREVRGYRENLRRGQLLLHSLIATDEQMSKNAKKSTQISYLTFSELPGLEVIPDKRSWKRKKKINPAPSYVK